MKERIISRGLVAPAKFAPTLDVRKGNARCRCQNWRISGRGSRTVRLRRMVTGGRGHDVLPRFRPSRWR